MKRFRASKELLGDLDGEVAADLIAAASDIALLLDDQGIIRDQAFGSEELAREWPAQLQGHALLGRPWIDTVTIESRPKVAALLARPAPGGTSWRHVNHPASTGPDIPILYRTMPVGRKGGMIAIGRDLRATAALQQRLVDVQQSMERDYARTRHVETRYRLLFQMTSEAVLIVDAASRKVLEVNPAASRLLGEATPRLVGRLFPEGFDETGMLGVQALLSTVRATGRADSTPARLTLGGREFLVAAALFRQENAALFLVRLVPLDADATAVIVSRGEARLLALVEHAPDGFVVTDPEGLIQAANGAFLELAQLATEAQAVDERLERWLGRPGIDLDVLTANLRQHGSIQLFATSLRGEYGAAAEVEVSAVAMLEGEQPCLGFAIRNVGRRPLAESRLGRELPRTVEQLTELVGRIPLKDLVRETTDVIERLCIETALELTKDNRASAAELLGLSRQSLYVKLRRYGLGDLMPETDG